MWAHAHPLTSQDPSKRYGASLGALSAGRVGISGFARNNLSLAVVTAIRYSAVRRQFGPSPDAEVPVLTYQLQQWRLLPYLAATVVFTHFLNTFIEDFIAFTVANFLGEKSVRQVSSHSHCNLVCPQADFFKNNLLSLLST